MSIENSKRSIANGANRAPGVLGAVAVIVVAVAGCTRGEAIETGAELQTITASSQSIISSVEATGTVEPIRIIEVKSQAGGEILELPVETGDRVQPGQLLVQIDPRDVRNAFDQAQADLDVAVARFDVGERQLSRIEQLHESDIVTEEELESAILEHANAKAALVRAEVNLELAADRMEDVTLRAPIAGTIVERAIEVGQVITGTRDLTGGTALMKMADLQEVQVRMLVDETDIGRLEPGLPAEITVEAYRDRTFRGSVLKIEPQAVVEQNVTMFAVLTRIANEEDLLRPGMNADVEVVVGRQEDVLALPNSGLKTQQEAVRIVEALGIEADVAQLARDAQEAASGAAPTESAAPEEDEEMINGRRLSEIQTMSQGERMEWFQGLSGAERGRVMQIFQQMRGGQGGEGGRGSGQPRPAFVFQQGAEGELTIKAVMIGLGNFDYTQIISGLVDGETVVSIPMSMIQQQDFINRIRSRTSLPGIGG
ncbi:MAG: efflux RND transporter periplasmic adaptor subunit [Gemmatimonadota bacterium]|nr:efflux RND transporter periplasmic adaptor subunit [Gemmatimonadota bacterium]